MKITGVNDAPSICKIFTARQLRSAVFANLAPWSRRIITRPQQIRSEVQSRVFQRNSVHMYHDASFAVLRKVSERLVVLPICIAECTHLREGFGITSTLFPFRFKQTESLVLHCYQKVPCFLHCTTPFSVTIYFSPFVGHLCVYFCNYDFISTHDTFM